MTDSSIVHVAFVQLTMYICHVIYIDSLLIEEGATWHQDPLSILSSTQYDRVPDSVSRIGFYHISVPTTTSMVASVDIGIFEPFRNSRLMLSNGIELFFSNIPCQCHILEHSNYRDNVIKSVTIATNLRQLPHTPLRH